MYRSSTKSVRIACLAAAAILSAGLVGAHAEYAAAVAADAGDALPVVRLEPVTVTAAPIARDPR